MDITFKALKETVIGRHVNRLRKHSSKDVRRLVKQLVRVDDMEGKVELITGASSGIGERGILARKAQRSVTMLAQSLTLKRGFCTANNNKIVASVLFERLPVIIPKIDPVVYAFQEFSFRWGQQYRRAYPDDFLKKSDARGKGDYQIDYVPAPRVTEADKVNDKRSLQRALDRRLYLLLYSNTCGTSNGKPLWHFPEKVYESEETLRKCAESALESVIGDLFHTYFVGNAPMGHMVMQPTENEPNLQPFKRFFFKSQVIATNKFNIGKCEDFVWVTKDELLEYFPNQAGYLNNMIIS